MKNTRRGFGRVETIVPQKKWHEDSPQLQITDIKNRAMPHLTNIFTDELYIYKIQQKYNSYNVTSKKMY